MKKRIIHKITRAAIRHDGEIFTLPRPNRHGDIIISLSVKGREEAAIAGEQGFINSKGQFLTRRAAAYHALKSGQVTKLKYSSKELYSEDLW